VTDNPPDASVYVEFCDRGSLQDLIEKYQQQTKLKVPERFIWHCFASLCDGLAYLQGGRSYILADDSASAPGWVPVLHRDLKPDNILLRSRDTVASKRYFYCVISDFGLASEDRPDHDPMVNKYQKNRSKLGTCTYFAPELCYNPYPRTKEERAVFPPIPNSSDRYKHSPESDLWALGACIYNLASLGNHIKLNNRPPHVDKTAWFEGQASRFESYTLDPRLGYSEDLTCAIRRVMRFKKEERANPIQAIFRIVRPGMNDSGFTTGIAHAGEDELPTWATRVHEYHSRKPIPQTDC
jgi:serine/threonine protein kinase